MGLRTFENKVTSLEEVQISVTVTVKTERSLTSPAQTGNTGRLFKIG